MIIIIPVIAFIVCIFVPIEVTSVQYDSIIEAANNLTALDLMSIKGTITKILNAQISNYNINDNLDFFDGMKNGFLIYGYYLKSILIRSCIDAYEAANKSGMFSGIVMFLFGLIKNVFTCLFSNLSMTIKLLTQGGGSYAMGYVVTFGITTFGVTRG